MGKRTSGEPNPQIRGIKRLDSSNKLCSVHIVEKWIIVRVLLLCVWCSIAGYWLCTCIHTVVAKNVIRSKLAKQKQDQNQLIRSYQGQVGSFPFERSSVGLGGCWVNCPNLIWISTFSPIWEFITKRVLKVGIRVQIFCPAKQSSLHLLPLVWLM